MDNNWQFSLFFYAILPLLISAIFVNVKVTTAEPLFVIEGDVLQAETEAIGWLRSMIVPNEIIPDPIPVRRRLILSYNVPEDEPGYRYIYSRSYVYDDALGIIAFTMVGDYRNAERIIGALERNLREDGSLFFAYNTDNSWPNEEEKEGAVVRMGAVAWVGYAATFYLAKRHEENENFIKEDVLAGDILIFAESIAEFILGNQVLDPEDRRYGLVKGGWGVYKVELQNGDEKPEEVYKDVPVSWVSMEHNIDIYFFLRDLYRITEKKKYLDAAMLIKEGLLSLWSDQHGQLFRGIKGDGVVDKALPLDGASWACMFLLSIGEERKAKRCLETIQRHFTSKSGDITGYRPYYFKTIYEDKRVNAYYFSENPEMRWKDINMIWIEGSFGVAAANLKAGNVKKAYEIIRAMLPFRENGGFMYATKTIPYKFSVYPSVASTAWFVITVEIMKSELMNKIFWGR